MIIQGIDYMRYLGMLEAQGKFFAIIIFRNRRYLLEKNEKIFGYGLIKLENEYILLNKEEIKYRINKK